MFDKTVISLLLDGVPATVTPRVTDQTAAIFHEMTRLEEGKGSEEKVRRLIIELNETAGSWCTSSAYREKLTMVAQRGQSMFVVTWTKNTKTAPRKLENVVGMLTNGYHDFQNVRLGYIVRTNAKLPKEAA